uniref:PWWP domain-containing protein n=1 Tax=Macrostomum lignano TaxID=282301 RepID=A0A1I8F8R1_9PLAT
VGLLDVDICGPSVPTMLGLLAKLSTRAPTAGRPSTPTSPSPSCPSLFYWPRQTKRDEHLSIVQLLKSAGVDGAIIVTTPQEVSLLDARKEVNFCRRLGVPVLGVVENMSGYVCPNCTRKSDIFPATTGGAAAMCKEFGLPLLARVPIEPGLARALDQGQCPIDTMPDEPATAKPVETPLAASTGPEDDSNPCRSFTWDDYLQNTGAIAADSDTFHHVEAAHASLCRPGMLFALPWKRDTYWPVRIATVSGPLLGVQFVGAASSVAKEQHQHQQPVWYSVASKTGKSLDWCRQNPTLVKPPPEVRVGDSSDTADDAVLKSLLLGKGEGEGEDAPTEMLDGDALQPAERILEGGLLECCDCLMPYALWFVK